MLKFTPLAAVEWIGWLSRRVGGVLKHPSQIVPPVLLRTSFALDRLAKSRSMPGRLRPQIVRLSTFLVQEWFRKSVSRARKQAAQRFPLSDKTPDLVFFLPERSRGWILEGICRDIAQQFRGTTRMHHSFSNLPPARAYFIAHYSTFHRLALESPQVLDGKTFVFFTHPREDQSLPMSTYAKILNAADHVLLMNSASGAYLALEGLDRGKTKVIHGAADALRFVPHCRGNGKVGFCTAFYGRKRPDLVLDLAQAMPHRRFLLVGKDWSHWQRFDELRRQVNLEYVEADYEAYPALYAQMDVFVSPALLEGGPIPLLEAMLSNVVPVASRTGFAPDIIRDGENGFLFSPDASVDTVARLVDKAFEYKEDVSATVVEYSWRRIAQVLEDLMGVK